MQSSIKGNLHFLKLFIDLLNKNRVGNTGDDMQNVIKVIFIHKYITKVIQKE